MTLDKIQAILVREPPTETKEVENEKVELEKLVQLKYILEKDRFEGLSRKIQLKPLDKEVYEDSSGNKKTRITKALFILKFGGELTHSGVNQAIQFGKDFRKHMYVNDATEQEYKGLLRLHSTYRHDLKCYTSDEGRC